MSDNGILSGGPAFPQRGDLEYKGISLRHWTATHCLPIAIEMLKMAAMQPGVRVDVSPTVIARNALILADALINEGRLLNAK